MKKLTPLKSIRKKCLDCQETYTDVKKCKFIECFLYPFRMGTGRAKVRNIRRYCLWCCVNNKKEVRLCPSESCPLYLYRFGKNPARKGIGGSNGFKPRNFYSRASSKE